MEMEYRIASLLSKTIISLTSSFTSSNSRCRTPFLKNELILLMTSTARVTA